MSAVRDADRLASMRIGGQLLADLHKLLRAQCVAGVSAATLDSLAYSFIHDHNATPSFLGYQGYKHTLCVSKNNEIVHGIPDAKKIMEPGDICSIDAGIYYQGYHVDAARTWAIDPISEPAQAVIDTAEAAFWLAMKQVRAGKPVHAIGRSIARTARQAGMATAENLCSHGVGAALHADPLIIHERYFFSKQRLQSGMTIAVEPMIVLGSPRTVVESDKWTISTQDGQYAAHYENTILVTDKTPEILTLDDTDSVRHNK